MDNLSHRSQVDTKSTSETKQDTQIKDQWRHWCGDTSGKTLQADKTLESLPSSSGQHDTDIKDKSVTEKIEADRQQHQAKMQETLKDITKTQKFLDDLSEFLAKTQQNRELLREC